MRTLPALLAALVLLGGCAAGVGDYGVTRVTVNPETGEISWTDGKEKASVEISYSEEAGFHYVASDVLAFDGQKLAAELQLELTKELAAAGISVAESIVKGAVVRAVGSAVVEGAGTLIGGKIKADAAAALAGSAAK